MVAVYIMAFFLIQNAFYPSLDHETFRITTWCFRIRYSTVASQFLSHAHAQRLKTSACYTKMFEMSFNTKLYLSLTSNSASMKRTILKPWNYVLKSSYHFEFQLGPNLKPLVKFQVPVTIALCVSKHLREMSHKQAQCWLQSYTWPLTRPMPSNDFEQVSVDQKYCFDYPTRSLELSWIFGLHAVMSHEHRSVSNGLFKIISNKRLH